MQENISPSDGPAREQVVFTEAYLAKITQEIAAARDFAELIAVLGNSQGLQDSHGKVHHPDRLVNSIKLIDDDPDSHSTQLITRTAGLRAKVIQLNAAKRVSPENFPPVERPAIQETNFTEAYLAKITQEIAGSRSFFELIAVLKNSQGLPGSDGRARRPDTLIHFVNHAMTHPDESTQSITRTAGLRDKVNQLLTEQSREMPIPQPEAIEEQPGAGRGLGDRLRSLFKGKQT